MQYKQIIQYLIAKRKTMHLKTEEVSHIIGVSESTVGKWEREERLPNLSALVNWCNALNVYLNLDEEKSNVPLDFKPSRDFINYVKQYYPEVDLNYERLQFIDYYTAKGIKQVNWTACFRAWIRRSKDFNTQKSKRKYASSSKTSSEFISERRNKLSNFSQLPNNIFGIDKKPTNNNR